MITRDYVMTTDNGDKLLSKNETLAMLSKRYDN